MIYRLTDGAGLVLLMEFLDLQHQHESSLFPILATGDQPHQTYINMNIFYITTLLTILMATSRLCDGSINVTDHYLVGMVP